MKLNRRKFFAFSIAAAPLTASTQNFRAQNTALGSNALNVSSTQPLNAQTNAPKLSVADIKDLSVAVGTSSTGFADVAAAVRGLAAVAGNAPATLNVIADLAVGDAKTIEIPAHITVKIAASGRFVVPAGKTLAIRGELQAGYAPIVAGAGQLDLSQARMPVIRPEWFYSGSGSWHTAINEAIRQAHIAGGHTVEFRAGKTYEVGDTLNLMNIGRVRLKGFVQIGSGNVPTIRYTGTGNGRAIDARSSGGVTLDSMSFEITDPNYTGIFVDLNHSSSRADTQWFTAIDCHFSGKIYSGEVDEPQNATKTHAFICCSRAIITTIERCRFSGAERGIKGVEIADYYSNVTIINNCTFNKCRRSISSPGQYNCNITNCTFEPYKGGFATALDYEFPAYVSYGLVFSNNYVGDLFAQAVTPVILRGIRGVQISGNIFSWHDSPNSTECIRIEICDGVSITGNTGGGMKWGVRFVGLSRHIHAAGNNWSASVARYVGLENLGDYSIADFDDGDQNLGQISNHLRGGIKHAGVFLQSGDIEIVDVGKSVILKSPNGTRWRLTVADNGAPGFTAV